MAYPDIAVWMNGERVGIWSWSRRGIPSLRYDPSWPQSPNARPLSVSLPIPAAGGEVTGAKVAHYFDNLLPDSSRIRDRLRRRFSASSSATADLLASVGRDCAGAAQLLPDGTPPVPHDRIECTSLNDNQVAEILDESLDDFPDGGSMLAEHRISIAGMQEKTALLRIGDRWHLPQGATPTTHILKLPLGLVGNMQADMTDSVENEWLCHTLLGLLGLPVAHTEIGRFGARKALVVERFDRRWMEDGRWIVRLPQEDFCQASGLPGDMKYESDGGPGIRACLALLAGGSNAKTDSLHFVLSLLAFWLLAATDGHAKNFSIFLERGGGYRLTPLYDVLSAWPIIGNGPNQVSPRRAKLSMALRGKNVHYHLHEIHTRHFQALAVQSGVPDAFDAMVALVLQVQLVLEEAETMLPPDYPRSVFTSIRRGMLAQADKFIAALP